MSRGGIFRKLGALAVVLCGVLAAALGRGAGPPPLPALDPWLRAELLVSAAARRLPPEQHLRLQRGLRVAQSAGRAQRVPELPAATPEEMAADAAAPLHCFLTGSPDEARLRAAGVEPGVRSNGVWSARVPRGALSRLLRVPGLAAVHLAPPVRLLLDRSMTASGADTVRAWSGAAFTGATGAGVVIGIVDSGVDLAHPDFRRPDGTSRLLAAWDQTDTIGPAPTILPIRYGTEWTPADVEAGRTRIVDPIGHGTHVAGAALGGGGPERKYVGMAPGADLVAVALSFDAASVVDGVDYVFRHAAALGRPAVVNLSLGTQYGPHDGTGPFDRAIDGLIGSGRVVVAAAGNEAQDALHAELLLGSLPIGDEGELEFVVPPFPDGDATPFRFMDLDAWYGGTESCEVAIITPGGVRFGPFPRDMADSLMETPEGTIYLGHTLFEGQSNVQLRLSNFRGVDPAFGSWRLRVARRAAGDPAAEFDAWIAGYSAWIPGIPGRRYSAPSFEDRSDPTEEINSPASAYSAIAVGSVNTRFCWPTDAAPFGTQCLGGGFGVLGGLSPFSCRGPTRDGRLKPDLAAPGLAIVSTLSGSLDPELRDLAASFVAPDDAHWALAGTSMAAPHVTGAVALLLERFPGIRLSDIVRRLQWSCVADAFTGSVYNVGWGFGKLHVGRLLSPGLGEIVLDSASVTALDFGVRVTWSARAGSGETGYRLTRSATPGGEATGVWTVDGAGGGVVIDRSAPEGSTAWYRLAARMNGGELRPAGAWSIEVPDGQGARLGPPLPNPSRGALTFDLRLPERSGEGAWELTLFDLAGRRVRRIASGSSGPDARVEAVTWDGRDDRGGRLAAGVYLARLSGDGFHREQRVIRLP